MIRKVLVANRSEIACRVIRACREMGIATVAVYSEADKNALHRCLADEAVCIGPASPAESYLNMDAVVKAAGDTGCDAVHPGYGFLAENHLFNRRVREAGLVFIGPEPEPMALLGSKTASRRLMAGSGVPVIPGMEHSGRSIGEFAGKAAETGYPVIIKSSAGGGGKGMRIVYREQDLELSVESSRRESLAAFGSDELYLEKYLDSPRHIEFQVAADKYGNAVCFPERECSIQRRHQKIIEESPSTFLNPGLRKEMGEAAVRAARAAGYTNVGTVEFLLDSSGNYYFLEVNTRIQVEHPITEAITGIDLVKLQIALAGGDRLPFTQSAIQSRGHAIECRICAEDAGNDFLPSPGKILYLEEAKGPGIRYDSGIGPGSDVPVNYDPIMAKLIAWGADREEARRRMIIALKENVILGVKTPAEFMIALLEHPEFVSGNTFTGFIGKHFGGWKPREGEADDAALLAVALYSKEKERMAVRRPSTNRQAPSPWVTTGKWEICSGQ